jgi:hypothetical protein
LKTKGEGDATMSVFVRASDAAAAAVGLQEAEDWPEGLEVRVRVARPHRRSFMSGMGITSGRR